MKKVIITIMILAAAAMQLRAQGFDSMILPKSVEELGKGDVSPVFVRHDGSFGIDASFMKWAPKSVNNTILGASAYYQLKDRYEVNLEFRQNSGQQYNITDPLGTITGQYKPKDMIAGLGFTCKITDFLAVGVKGRYMSANLGEELTISGFGIDAGVQYFSDALTVEFGAANLGSEVALAKVDGSYSIAGITASAEVDYMFAGALMAAAGVEYSIKDIAFVRAGYHYGADTALPSFATVGAGARFAGVSINAAFLIGSEGVGNTLMFGLGYSF